MNSIEFVAFEKYFLQNNAVFKSSISCVTNQNATSTHEEDTSDREDL